MNNSKFFKNNEIVVSGQELGYVNDIAQGDNPVNSVYDCLNFDFKNGYTERRLPYDVLEDLTTVLPSGYSIDNFFIKDFIDKSNNSEECIIVVAKKSSNETKIYINKYYNAGVLTGNGKSTTSGWITEWTELTEKESFVFTNDITTAYGTATIDVTKDVAADYYRGWFVFSSGICQGFVTKSTAGDLGDTITLTIRMNPYRNSSTSIALKVIGDGGTYDLTRFPVNVLQTMTDVTDVDILESSNVLKFTCGVDKRILWLGLINNRNYFNQTSAIGSGDNAYYTKWYGWWLDFDIPKILNKKIYTNNYYTATGETFVYSQSDILELGAILKYRIYTTSGAQTTVKAASLGISLDGFQPIFVKNLLIDRNAVSHASNESIWTKIEFIWGLDFNRRLTDLHLFYGEDSNFNTLNTSDENIINEIFPTYQMETNAGGSINFTDKPRNTGEYDFAYNAFTTEFINNSTVNYGYHWNNVVSVSGNYNYANGLSLNAFLNGYYYNDIYINCKKIISIDNLIMAIGVQNKESQIALTNIINGDVETESIYSPERMTNLSLGNELIVGAKTQLSEFLIFTEKEAIICEILDKQKNIIAIKDRFANQGIVSKKSLVTAKFRGELQGVFWAGNKGIYSFVNNQVIELTQGKWNNEYLALSDEIKSGIVGGYLPNKSDIFFLIDEKIYIYNLIFQHWKKYEYEDIPGVFFTHKNGELTFASDTNYIFRTEKKGTEMFADKNTDRYDSYFVQLFNHSRGDIHKILNQIELLYDIELDETTADIQITAGSNTTNGTDIVSSVIEVDEGLSEKITNRVVTKNKIRSNFYNVKLLLTSLTGDIHSFKLYSMVLKAKLTGKKLFKV